MLPGMKQNQAREILKKPGGCLNTHHANSCTGIKYAPASLSRWFWMDFNRNPHFWGIPCLLLCYCLWASKWMMVYKLGEIEMSTLDQITGDLEIERGLKPSFALHFMNEYGILSSFIQWQMSLFSEGTWGDLTLILGNPVSFLYFKISNFISRQLHNLFARICISSDYGIQ